MKKLTVFPAPELEQNNEVYITIAEELEPGTIDFDKEQTKISKLLNQADNQVEQNYEGDLAAKLKEQIDNARKNSLELISHRGGVVVYITPNDVYYYHVGIATPELISISDAPHLKPLIENYQYSTSFHLLVLNQKDIRLFEGDANGITEIELTGDDAPKTLEAALGSELTGGELTGGGFGTQGQSGEDSYHGFNETSNEKAIDRENYFRVVDNYIYENYSLPEEKPLILYALPDNQVVFRRFSKNQYLLEDGIKDSGAKLDMGTIQEKALAKNREIVKKEQQMLLDLFRETTPEFRIDNQLNDLAYSAVQGKISELVINADYTQAGSIDEEGGYREDDGNFLQQIVAKVLETKGEIYVIPAADLPEGLNISARLRY